MRTRLFESCGHFFVEVPPSYVEAAGIADDVRRLGSVPVPVDYDTQPRRFMAILRDADARPGPARGDTWCGLSKEEIEALEYKSGKRTTVTAPYGSSRSAHGGEELSWSEESEETEATLEDVAETDDDVEEMFEEVREEIEQQDPDEGAPVR